MESEKKRDGAINYYINEEHPILAKELKSESITKKSLKAIFKLIGETTPVESIIQNYSENPESVELRNESKELESGTIKLAKMMFESLKKAGTSNEIAIKQIFNIQPFNEYPQLLEYFK
ncbi:hypothetical protein PG911_09195 [Tenacibaculum ovolyticum]|uniref:hypothetical protein n=1 Tax=Tenacibaculum ovolyticum TaxID=104270 RepID=UPI0022F3E8DA|nr:hypothetical protein [Tenacibaculum ovolyticum]WBX78421.1 hypothetical protein PG911_09195 [Tenacibaculum ovolyticum]